MQCGLHAVAHEIGIDIACHSPVGAGISTVGRNIHFYQIVALHAKISGSGHSHGGIFREHHDAVVALANANLIFGANHAVALHAA